MRKLWSREVKKKNQESGCELNAKILHRSQAPFVQFHNDE